MGSITGNTNTLAGNVPPKVLQQTNIEPGDQLPCTRIRLRSLGCHILLADHAHGVLQADLGDLDGMANGLGGSGMIDGGEYDGAKAYKDSKVCYRNTYVQRNSIL